MLIAILLVGLAGGLGVALPALKRRKRRDAAEARVGDLLKRLWAYQEAHPEKSLAGIDCADRLDRETTNLCISILGDAAVMRCGSVFSNGLRETAARLLGRSSSVEAAAPLVEALDDDYPPLREQALKSLIRLGGSAVAKLLSQTQRLSAAEAEMVNALAYSFDFAKKTVVETYPSIGSLYGAVESALGSRAVEGSSPLLVLVLPPGTVESDDFVKAASRRLRFGSGRVSVVYGPIDVGQGEAEAMLAKFDLENGTSYLSSPFVFGAETESGVRFGYVQAGGRA